MPGNYWHNNGGSQLSEEAVEHNCLDFIFSSTCATYGEYDGISFSEDMEQFPVNPYGSSKRAVEEILQHFSVAMCLNTSYSDILMWLV